LSRKCGSLNPSHPYGPSRPVTGKAFKEILNRECLGSESSGECLALTDIYIYRERERERARQTDRQTEREEGQKNGENNITSSLKILSRVKLTLDGVWIGDWIY
jgi:hypothetical protein